MEHPGAEALAQTGSLTHFGPFTEGVLTWMAGSGTACWSVPDGRIAGCPPIAAAFAVHLLIVVAARSHGSYLSEAPSPELSLRKAGTMRAAEIANGFVGGQAKGLAVRAPRILVRVCDQHEHP